MSCSCRPSSPTCAGRTTGCRTIRTRRSGGRWSNRLPARSTHLGVDHVDSYVLHGPESGRGWSAADREVWSAMERLHRERRARLLGVSNISRDQLVTLCGSATVAPALVQNRCYARTGWDQAAREVCRERGIVYQGFPLLTANQRELRGATVAAIARRLGATIPQVVFRFALPSAWWRSPGPPTGPTCSRTRQRSIALSPSPTWPAWNDSADRCSVGAMKAPTATVWGGIRILNALGPGTSPNADGASVVEVPAVVAKFAELVWCPINNWTGLLHRTFVCRAAADSAVGGGPRHASASGPALPDRASRG